MSTQSSATALRTGTNPFLKAVAAISTLCGWVSALMIVMAVLITCQMIFIRFVLNGSTIWQTEAVIYLAIASTLVGLPFVQLLRGHVNVDLFPMMLKGRARRALAIGTSLVAIGIIGIMFWYGYDVWHQTYSRGWKSETVWGVRLWIPYLSIPVGFGLLLLQLIADLVALVLKIDTPFGLEEA
jgi:TRAP-type C4-dicarboxylate transport system permease small subunit